MSFRPIASLIAAAALAGPPPGSTADVAPRLADIVTSYRTDWSFDFGPRGTPPKQFGPHHLARRARLRGGVRRK